MSIATTSLETDMWHTTPIAFQSLPWKNKHYLNYVLDKLVEVLCVQYTVIGALDLTV